MSLDTEWRMNVAAPLSYTVVGSLKLNYQIDFGSLSDDELLTLISKYMPIDKFSVDEKNMLLEEVRRLL